MFAQEFITARREGRGLRVKPQGAGLRVEHRLEGLSVEPREEGLRVEHLWEGLRVKLRGGGGGSTQGQAPEGRGRCCSETREDGGTLSRITRGSGLFLCGLLGLRLLLSLEPVHVGFDEVAVGDLKLVHVPRRHHSTDLLVAKHSSDKTHVF